MCAHTHARNTSQMEEPFQPLQDQTKKPGISPVAQEHIRLERRLF